MSKVEQKPANKKLVTLEKKLESIKKSIKHHKEYLEIFATRLAETEQQIRDLKKEPKA